MKNILQNYCKLIYKKLQIILQQHLQTILQKTPANYYTKTPANYIGIQSILRMHLQIK